MKKIIRNGAKVSRVAKLKKNPKQLLNQEAQDHDFVNEDKNLAETAQQPLETEDTTSTDTPKHVIATSKEVDETEDERKHRYASSITNTITNCGVFNAHATTFGVKYATNKDLYKLVNLIAMEAEVKTIMKNMDDAIANYKYPVAARQDEFDGLEALCALVVAEAELGGISLVTLGQLRAIMRLLQGARKVAIDPKVPGNHRSVSQKDYDNMVAHFAMLLTMIEADTNYDPATDAIKLLALQAKLAALNEVNLNAQVAEAELDAARTARNEYFNTPVTGLCDVFMGAKKVVLINFGRQSEQYKKVSGLAFRKIRTR